MGSGKLQREEIMKRSENRVVTSILFFAILARVNVQAAPNALLVWHFDQGVTNPWGGEYNVYSRQPSWARTYLDASGHKPGSTHSLRITAHREASGFCGVWLEFHPASRLPRRYADAGPYKFLSFWIKGRVAGANFEATLDDDTAQQRSGKNPAPALNIVVPEEAQNDWQEVVVPLANFQGVNVRRLARLVLNFTSLGDSRFYIDDVAFKAEKTAAVPVPKSSSPVRGRVAPKPITAMWVWNAQGILGEGGGSDRFFQFCAKTEVSRIFLALYIATTPTPSGPNFELQHPDDYRKFLERAHQRGLQVEALAGNPEWAARENHSAALAVVDTVLNFNRSGSPGARFDALHFDVEPYVLAGYADPEHATRLLQDFLQMISLCARRVHSRPGLRFTCDVPAYFYPAPGRPELEKFEVEFKGRRATVGEHLTDMLDSVTLMDYRNEADGAGGAILAAIPALQYAASKGKTILVGLETSVEPDSTVYFICGLPREEFRKRLDASGLGEQLSVDGYRLASFSDDINIHLGMAGPAHMDRPARQAFDLALVRLAKQFGAASDPARFPAGEILEEARGALSSDSEWDGFETFKLTDQETKNSIEGFRTVHRMIPRTTFHGLGFETLEEESRSLREWLRPYASFGGLAIHHYESYRELREGK
jgi:hypothetical protein